MHRFLPCLLAALLAAPASAAPLAAPSMRVDYSAAKALADHDEAMLPTPLSEHLHTLQRAALDEGVANCATPRPDTSAFVIVVQLQADGSVGASWRNGTTPMALCLERFLRQRPLLAPPQAPLYLSYEVSFEK
ncbi:hypothetical protein [Xanthomonas albilineans]|uniref:hypothetical protein n=1 Tax=Xanthomonas albilineans TaxID=29447 RepID=UPI0005F318CD|nr:hypothetical protein [Xanthomonas albilineans]